MAKGEFTMIEAAGREVRLSNPGKVYFPRPGWTKLDLVEYYLTCAEAVTVHLRERPTVMKRFVNGIMEEPIWQKRVPKSIPDWLQTATVAFPSGRTAEELVANDAAHLVWAVNLGVIDFNPWPARREDLDHHGHGESEGERALVEDFEVYLDDLEQVVRRARAEHPDVPLVLLGHSLGGLIATRYAQARGGLDALVISAPVIGGNPEIEALLGMDPIPEVPIPPDALSLDPRSVAPP